MGVLPTSLLSARTCVLVLGMHRSGTSAITRIINLLGAQLPRNLLGEARGNPAGHWEPRLIVDFNSRLLEASGARWNIASGACLDRLAPDVLSVHRAELHQIVESEYGGAPLIVLKDPRISRLVPFYAQVLEEAGYEVRCVIAHRDPMSVARSIHARNSHFAPGLGLLLWLLHTLEAERATRMLQRTVISFDKVMSDPGPVLSAALGRLDVVWPRPLDAAMDDIQSSLRPDLYHQRPGDDVAPDVPATVDTSMQALATDPQAERAMADLDQQRRVVAALVAEFSDDLDHGLSMNVLRALLDYASAQVGAEAAPVDNISHAEGPEIEAVRQQAAVALAALESVYNSRSWRLTAPLRSLSRGISSLAHPRRGRSIA